MFLVIDGEIHTPKPDCFLDGITRRTSIDLARRRGIKVIERAIFPDDLKKAQEFFITGTAAEVTPVGEVAEHKFTVGAVTRQMMADYSAEVRKPASQRSAAAIRDRLFKAFEPFHHDAVRAARSDKLKRLGLSNAKIKAIKEIGKAVSTGAIDLNAVGEMDADAAHALLTALHGVGPWTADIYLLFCLGHADAFPAGDLAVQEAARIALDLRKRPDPKALTKIAEAWRPWRGVAAHLMWAYYHVVKRREGISLETADKKPIKKTKKRTAKAVDAKRHWPQIKKTKISAKKKTETAKRAKKAKGVKRAT